MQRRQALKWRLEKFALKRQLRILRRRAGTADRVRASGVLSEDQLRRLGNKRRLHWKAADVATALGLRCISHKAFSYVQETMMVPTPYIRTLPRSIRGFQVMPGFIEVSAQVLDAAVRTMTQLEKLAVMCFDEVGLNARWCYDQAAVQVLQTGKMQVMMVRGLRGAWKQPCFSDCYRKMTPDLLASLVQMGLTVVACVNDMGSDNENMWRKSGLGDNCSIPHPAGNGKLVY